MIMKEFLQYLVKEFKESGYFNPFLDLEEPEYEADRNRISQAVDLYGLYQLGNGEEGDYEDTIACLMAIVEEFIAGSDGSSYFHTENRLIGYIRQCHVFFKGLADSVYDKMVTVYVEPDESGMAYVAVISQPLGKVLLNVSIKASGSWFDSFEEMEKFVSECAYDIQNKQVEEEIKRNAVNSVSYLALKAFQYDRYTQEIISEESPQFTCMEDMFLTVPEACEFTSVWGGETQEYLQRIEDKLAAGFSLDGIKEIIAIEIAEGEHDTELFAKFLVRLDFPKLAEVYRQLGARKEVA